jgi:molybdenum cofactor synthesis domain-containing protein
MNISQVALAVIGDEVLLGEVKDRNIELVSQELFRLGADLVYACVLPDEEQFLVEHLSWMKDRYDWVITTGGIGATHDDLTKGVISRITGNELVVAPEAVLALEDRLGAPLPDKIMELAMVPEGAELITNELTAAPAFIIANFIVLPGIPRLVQSMLGVLETKVNGSEFFFETIVTPRRESEIAHAMEKVQGGFPDVKVGSYPRIASDGGPRVKIVLRSRNRDELDKAVSVLKGRIGG